MSIQHDSNKETDLVAGEKAGQLIATNENGEKDGDSSVNEERTIAGRPADPNRLGGGVQIPPGVHPADVRDPGNATPDAPPVDNRS